MYLVKFWFIKLFGALYLAWIAISHFKNKQQDDEAKAINKEGFLVRTFGLFWGTVITVELMDVAFSVDSISTEVWVLLIGGMLGILMMRTIAGFFVTLIDKVPEMETTAFILIGIIAIKMLLSVIHIEVSHYVFFAVLVVAFITTFIVHAVRNRQTE